MILIPLVVSCGSVSGHNDDLASPGPNACLRGLSSGDLMAIADDGEVFQHFVRSLSGGDPSTAAGAGGGSPVSPVSAARGAIPKTGNALLPPAVVPV